ncbi:MAG: hypothetical protein V3U99_06025 [Alphaproteobacteria bacterium]
MERRLSAILAADVVGYSRLMGEDEAGTLDALKTHRKELSDPKAAQYGGRTVKFMGDGARAIWDKESFEPNRKGAKYGVH